MGPVYTYPVGFNVAVFAPIVTPTGSAIAGVVEEVVVAPTTLGWTTVVDVVVSIAVVVAQDAPTPEHCSRLASSFEQPATAAVNITTAANRRTILRTRAECPK